VAHLGDGDSDQVILAIPDLTVEPVFLLVRIANSIRLTSESMVPVLI